MARIAVVGSYGTGLSLRVPRMPGPGETVIGGPFDVQPGGKGSNQAVGAARLGARVDLLTALGTDPFAREAKALWEREGVNAARTIEVDASTMVGVILVEDSGQNRIAIAPGALELLDEASVDAFGECIATADVCLVQLEIPVAAASRALAVARESGTITVLNPAPARPVDSAVLALADFLVPNELEAATLVGRKGTARELGAELLAAGVRYAVITLGERGAICLWETGSELVPGVEVQRVVDTTGAGDAFNAAFAVALAEGAEPIEATRRGCVAGAFSVQQWGVIPGLPTREELDGLGSAHYFPHDWPSRTLHKTRRRTEE
ncbi:MAG TPA: ribokinase [Chloroflexota bacterium]